jgi:hypothetical protein
MIIAPYRDQLDELQKMAARGGWDKASMAGAIELNTVHGAQGRERRVVITTITRSSTKSISNSFMSESSWVNVMTSRAMDVFFVVGSKSAIMGLDPTNPLRQVLQCYHETTPGFVLSAGRAPFKVPEEDVLTRAHGERLIETMNRMQRGYRAKAELEDREVQRKVLDAELLLLTNTHQDLIRYKMKHLKIVFLENELAEEARWPMWRD